MSFLNVYAPYSLLLNGWQNQFLLTLHSFLVQKSLHSGGLQLPSPPLGLKRYSDPCGEEVFGWVISSDLLPFNHPDTLTLLHRSSGSCSSPDIVFAPFSLAFSCSWEVLQDLDSHHRSILLSVPLPPAYRPNKCPPSFNFQKACSISLSSTAAFFTFLALKAAKSSTPFGRIQRHPKAWWSAEVEEAVSERRKAFAAAHRSDEDLQAYISISRRTSSDIAKAKAEAWQTTCSSLSPRSNPKPVHSILRYIAGSPSSSSSSSSSCVAEPGAASLSPTEPRALWSPTRFFALLSLPLNFLRLPPTSLRPLSLAQTKLLIPC